MSHDTGDTPASINRFRSVWREWLRPILLVVLVATAFRSAVADWNDVPTGSMKPTILEGDRIFVNKLAYDLKLPYTRIRLRTWANPQRGDIVILYSPEDGKRLVKRVVGLPGDTVAMVANRLAVNGDALKYAPIDVPEALSKGTNRGKLIILEEFDGATHHVMLTPGSPTPDSFGPVEIPPDCYFVMGDNRDRSHDSRYFGFVDRRAIVGRATGVAASVNPERNFRPRWERFFTALQ